MNCWRKTEISHKEKEKEDREVEANEMINEYKESVAFYKKKEKTNEEEMKCIKLELKNKERELETLKKHNKDEKDAMIQQYQDQIKQNEEEQVILQTKSILQQQKSEKKHEEEKMLLQEQNFVQQQEMLSQKEKHNKITKNHNQKHKEEKGVLLKKIDDLTSQIEDCDKYLLQDHQHIKESMAQCFTYSVLKEQGETRTLET